jgi:hypothetical protein
MQEELTIFEGMCDFKPKVRSQIFASFLRNVFYRLSLKLLISLALPFFLCFSSLAMQLFPFYPPRPQQKTSPASANTVSGFEMTKHIKVKFELQRPDS